MMARARARGAATKFSLIAAVVLLGLAAWAYTQRAAAQAGDALCAGVELAPRLASDRGTPPTQTLDARGRYVPVIMVHGWTSRATHSRARSGSFSHLIDLSTDPGTQPAADRSLVGQLQKLPGAAVFTFDYHDYAARWVTDKHLGPALAGAIDCLYAKTGEKVIIVAHSMGGLIARWAVTPDAPDGAQRAGRVSSVVTFGTPQTGSLVALLAAGVVDAGSANGNAVLVALRLMLADCGALTTVKIKTGSVCDFLPDFVQAFDSQAGRALRSGSDELGELDAFPKKVPALDALAGDTVLEIPGKSWFSVPWETDRVNVGDVIVLKDSATNDGDGATHEKLAQCRYQLNAYRSATDSIGLKLAQVGRADVAQPLWKILGPCFHTNLMRTIQLTNEATALINQDISARPPSTTPQPPLTPEPVVDDQLPVCRDYERMESGERDVALRRMQEAHGDTTSRILTRISVSVFCKLNPGRHIDGVYAPGSRSNPVDGGAGPLPVCSDWRELDDAASDAALLRLAHSRGDRNPSISTLRLTVGAFCAIYPNRTIDGVSGGG